MLYEILDETLSKLAEHEKHHPDKLITKHASYASLKSQIEFFKDYWVEPTVSQLQQREQS